MPPTRPEARFPSGYPLRPDLFALRNPQSALDHPETPGFSHGAEGLRTEDFHRATGAW
jgi:hypothetical protein